MRYLVYKGGAASVLAFLFLFLGFPQHANGQDGFEEWKKNYLNEFKEFQNEYDKEFHEMLQKEWEQFDIEISGDFYPQPKPNVIPKVEASQSPQPKTTISLKTPKTGEAPPKKTKQEIQKRDNSRAKEAGTQRLQRKITPTFKPNVEQAKIQTNHLIYFNTPIQYKFYTAFKTCIDHPVTKKSISNFWKYLSTKDYPPFLHQIRQIRSQLSLNDYGYAQLLENIGTQIYGKDSPEATLFTWFMLTQSGFGTRIAYNNDSVFLLVKVSPSVFKTSYFTINGSRYYALSLNGSYSKLPSHLYTYQGNYPNSEEKELDLLFAKLPALPKKEEKRTLEFTYHDTTYTFEIPVNLQVITYLKNYPKAQLDLYFHSRMYDETHEELMRSLRPLLEDKSDVQKSNILLRFVQRAFAYQTDQEQFNAEKKMFPEETIYYPASDCDDRSILFAYLLEHLTGLDYIVLRYPGHLTPAVHFPAHPPKGDRVEPPLVYNGKSYYITDPTYFGADAGMIMPKFRNTEPDEIFDL